MSKALLSSSQVFSDLDRLIREGALGDARQILLDLNLQKVSRAEALGFADLGRRLNMPKFMLQVLRPIVRSEIPLNPPVSVKELALYATALSRIGSFREAEKILNSLDGQSSPEIWLYQAQNQMLQWNYTKPVSPLKRYIRAQGLTEYERLVGQVNLAASHIWNMKWDAGDDVLAAIQSEVLKKPDLESYKLIHGYSYELMAEMAILKGELATAEIWIVKARDLLSGSRSRYEFFVKKWQAILDLLKSPLDLQLLENLRLVRAEALQLKDWETRRDCEFYEALATRNDFLYLKVYFGTPYLSYRKRIEAIYKPTFQWPANFLWSLAGEESADSRRIFNMRTASEEGGEANLSSKPLLLKLLEVLTRDLFRPLALGSLVAELYPDEYFNPITSPQKAYQAIVRLRDWFQENEMPLDVIVEGDNYQLVATAPFMIRLWADNRQAPPEKKASEIERLAQIMQDQIFTSADAARELGISARSAQRILEKALAGRRLLKTATGRSTRYRFHKKSRG